MAKRSADQVRRKSEMAGKIIKHHFGVSSRKIAFMHTGLTNFVFESKTSAGEFIIRISDDPIKINDYLKEQWAIARAREAGIPVADILEVGNGIVHAPYMLQRKVPGIVGLHHPDCKKIIYQLGNYARIIHSIPTKGFGNVFDWSDNQLSKNISWKAYLANELNFTSLLEILDKYDMLSKPNFKKLTTYVSKIQKWKKPAVLNHGDIRLKNVIANDGGKIMAIIDWDNCSSNIAPVWDFSIALHDLSIDEKQEFLQGYGLPLNEYKEMVFALKTFNILNYAKVIKRLAESKQLVLLEQYRLRLNGYYDLFSL